jgi:hypothetical protein
MKPINNTIEYALEIKLLALIVAIMNYLDCVLSIKMINLYGIESEANPLMRQLLAYSPATFLICKTVIVTAFLIFSAYRTDLWIARTGILFSAFLYLYVMFLHFIWVVQS